MILNVEQFEDLGTLSEYLTENWYKAQEALIKDDDSLEKKILKQNKEKILDRIFKLDCREPVEPDLKLFPDLESFSYFLIGIYAASMYCVLEANGGTTKQELNRLTQRVNALNSRVKELSSNVMPPGEVTAREPKTKEKKSLCIEPIDTIPDELCKYKHLYYIYNEPKKCFFYDVAPYDISMCSYYNDLYIYVHDDNKRYIVHNWKDASQLEVCEYLLDRYPYWDEYAIKFILCQWCEEGVSPNFNWEEFRHKHWSVSPER